jgi:ubiquitin carboxyl-terminal hydrolase 8
MDLSKYHNKGMTGLENLGNTCFLNSCMQVMNHTYELNHFLDTIEETEKNNNKKLLEFYNYQSKELTEEDIIAEFMKR